MKEPYTSESLKLLLSEEGQRNAIFACFGSAAQHSQLFESELREFLGAYNRLRGTAVTVDDLENSESKKDKKTMGKLLNLLNKHVKFEPHSIETTLDEALKKRNFLMHHFFLEREGQMGSEDGRLRLMQELIETQTILDLVRGWIAGLRVAMLEASEGRRTESTSDETIFSAVIELPE